MVRCGVKAQSIFALAMLTELLVAQPSATAQEASIDTTALERTFRQSSRGAVMPYGPLYTRFYGHAAAARISPATCSMQVLTIFHPDIENPEHISVETRLRFLSRNDGTRPVGNSRDAIDEQCQQLDPLDRWFLVGPNADQDALIFAAWHATGALHAIGAQIGEYEGFDLSQYPNPSASIGESPTQIRRHLESFAREAGDAPSFASVQAAGEQSVATITFGGDGMAGSVLDVTITFTSHFNPQTREIERRLTGIEVGAVQGYVV